MGWDEIYQSLSCPYIFFFRIKIYLNFILKEIKFLFLIGNKIEFVNLTPVSHMSQSRPKWDEILHDLIPSGKITIPIYNLSIRSNYLKLEQSHPKSKDRKNILQSLLLNCYHMHILTNKKTN